jgi:uncharacterized membrane protein YtjA (UPF0391 family)
LRRSWTTPVVTVLCFGGIAAGGAAVAPKIVFFAGAVLATVGVLATRRSIVEPWMLGLVAAALLGTPGASTLTLATPFAGLLLIGVQVVAIRRSVEDERVGESVRGRVPERARPLHMSGKSSSVSWSVTTQTRRTSLRALESEGVRQLNVLDMATLERIVSEAVARAVAHKSELASAAVRREVEHEARRDFLELLDRHERALAAKSDEERRRRELEDQVSRLRASILQQQETLDRQRAQAGLAMTPESLSELETTFARIIEANKGKELEQRLGECFDGLVGRVKSSYEDILERRIVKLNQALAEAEHALEHVATTGYDDGIASIYRTVQGLAPGEPGYAKKKAALGLVFLENLALRGLEITAEDRALASVPSPTVLPEGFTPPLDPVSTEVAF